MLMHLAFIAYLFAVWMVVLACEVQAGAREGTSIGPALPLFPIAGWVLAATIEQLQPHAGWLLIGGLHALILVGCAIFLLRQTRARATRPLPAARVIQR